MNGGKAAKAKAAARSSLAREPTARGGDGSNGSNGSNARRVARGQDKANRQYDFRLGPCGTVPEPESRVWERSLLCVGKNSIRTV
jgi:hypothetical protein